MANAQNALYLQPTNHVLISKEKTALVAYNKASLALEKFLQQKSKITWLKLGDETRGSFMRLLKAGVLVIVF